MKRQTIVITGASSGLGYEMAKQFAEKGHSLALCARRIDRLEQLKQEILAIRPDTHIAIKALDVNQHDAVFETFKQFKHEFGILDRIIVNAGLGKGAAIGTGYFHANKETATTNFISALAQCEAALEIFRAQNNGHLVTISSVSAVRGFRRAMTVYAATKAALSSMTEGIRLDVMNTPIKVTTIHPGFIRSELSEKANASAFMVDTNVGVRSIIKAIEKEKANAFVPTWPWAILRYGIAIMPLSWLKKFS